MVREIPALRVDERFARVEELDGRVRAVGAEHLGVDLRTLLAHAHLDERLREPRLRVLRLIGIGELLRERVQRVLRLHEVAERRVDRTLLHVGGRRPLALGIDLKIGRIALRRVQAVLLEVRLGTLHAAPTLADEEERRLAEECVLLLVTGRC